MPDFEIRLRKFNLERRQMTGRGIVSDPVVGGILYLEVYNNIAGSFQYGDWHASAGDWSSSAAGVLDHQQGRFPYFDPPNDWEEPRRVTVTCTAEGDTAQGERISRPLREQFWLQTAYSVDKGVVKARASEVFASIRADLADLEKLLGQGG